MKNSSTKNTSVSISGLTKVDVSKKLLFTLLKNFKNVQEYNDFGFDEYRVFTSSFYTLAAIDINTKDIFINLKLINI